VIYDPATELERVIAPAPPVRLVEKLMERNVEPISVGRSIVGTWEPHQATVLNVIQELGLESQIIFNKGAVMVLPPGVNKASGLKAALAELDIAVPNAVGVGDAENDHAFLKTENLQPKRRISKLMLVSILLKAAGVFAKRSLGAMRCLTGRADGCRGSLRSRSIPARPSSRSEHVCEYRIDGAKW
jgi:hypothetical protein